MYKIIYLPAIAIVAAAGAISSGCSATTNKAAVDSLATRDAMGVTSGDSDKNALKVDRNNVPKKVTDLYSAEHPATNNETWYAYGYPNFNNTNDWYDNWYDSPPYNNSKSPAYYMVDFSDSVNSGTKTLYSNAGQKVAVHKMISSLPNAVSSAVNNGEYKDWTMGSKKEEIFKDKDNDELKVYRVDVSKGTEKHVLYFQTNGTLLKDKKN